MSTDFFGSKRCFLLAFYLALIPLLWGPGIIDGIDVSWKDNAFRELLLRISGIDPSINGGADRSNNYGTLVWMALEALFTAPFYHSGILSPVAGLITQRLFFGFIIFIIACIFLRTCERLTNRPLDPFAAILIGVYFCCSYYFYFAWARLQLNILSIPVFLTTLTLAQAINTGRYKKEWLCYFLPSAFLSATLCLQPALVAMWIFEVIVLAVFEISSLRAKVRFALLASGGFILVSIYWIVPFAAYIHGNNLADGSRSKEVYDVMNLFDMVSAFTTYSNVLAGAADFSFFDSYIKPYNPPAFESLSAYSLKKILLILINAAGMAYGIARYKPETKNIIRSLCIMYLLSVFIGLGGFGPQGRIMRYLVSDAPLFWVFRATWQKAGMLQLVSMSVLLYFALRELFTYLSTHIARPQAAASLMEITRGAFLLLGVSCAVMIACVYVGLRVSADFPAPYEAVKAFIILTAIMSAVYCAVVAYMPKKMTGWLLPVCLLLYFSGVLIINAFVPPGEACAIPRGAPLAVCAILILLSTVCYYPHLLRPAKTASVVFIALFLMVVYIHIDFLKGNHFISHRVPGSYAYEVQAGYRPEIPPWIYYVAQTIDKPGCMSILLPVSRANLIKWGWGGASDVLVSRGLLHHSTLIFKEYGQGYTVTSDATSRERNNELFDSLMSDRKLDVALLQKMGVCYFVLRTGFNDRPDFTRLPTRFYKTKLDAMKTLIKAPLEGYAVEPHEHDAWELYYVGPPLTQRNGYTRANFIFGSHFSYYLDSPDPDIDAQFIAFHIPLFLQKHGLAARLLIAKPFYYFLWGLAAFAVGMAGLLMSCRYWLKEEGGACSAPLGHK